MSRMHKARAGLALPPSKLRRIAITLGFGDFSPIKCTWIRDLRLGHLDVWKSQDAFDGKDREGDALHVGIHPLHAPEIEPRIDDV
mmetsp:Transcript_33133/g.105599  ORF Transcript_33133/g.105599 Transcript_33133/m.105599 type:complete len:85 (-) Transcript_33133:225-479(-)